MRLFKRNLTQVTGDLASSTKSIDIPTDYYLQQLIYYITFQYDTGSSVSADEDAPWSIIDRVRLKLRGAINKTIVDLDGELLKDLNTYDYGKAPPYTLDTTASQTDLTAVVTGRLDFRVDKKDAFDVSAVIPALALNSVKVEFEFGGASALGTGFSNVDTFTIDLAIIEIIPDEGEVLAPAIPQLLETDFSFPSTGSGKQQNIPTGAIVKRHLAHLETSAGARSNTVITSLSVKHGATEILGDTKVVNIRTFDELEYGVAPPTGCGMLDYADINSIAGALDLTDAKEGDVKLVCTVATANAVLKLLEESYV